MNLNLTSNPKIKNITLNTDLDTKMPVGFSSKKLGLYPNLQKERIKITLQDGSELVNNEITKSGPKVEKTIVRTSGLSYEKILKAQTDETKVTEIISRQEEYKRFLMEKPGSDLEIKYNTLMTEKMKKLYLTAEELLENEGILHNPHMFEVKLDSNLFFDSIFTDSTESIRLFDILKTSIPNTGTNSLIYNKYFDENLENFVPEDRKKFLKNTEMKEYYSEIYHLFYTRSMIDFPNKWSNILKERLFIIDQSHLLLHTSVAPSEAMLSDEEREKLKKERIKIKKAKMKKRDKIVKFEELKANVPIKTFGLEVTKDIIERYLSIIKTADSSEQLIVYSNLYNWHEANRDMKYSSLIFNLGLTLCDKSIRFDSLNGNFYCDDSRIIEFISHLPHDFPPLNIITSPQVILNDYNNLKNEYKRNEFKGVLTNYIARILSYERLRMPEDRIGENSFKPEYFNILFSRGFSEDHELCPKIKDELCKIITTLEWIKIKNPHFVILSKYENGLSKYVNQASYYSNITPDHTFEKDFLSFKTIFEFESAITIMFAYMGRVSLLDPDSGKKFSDRNKATDNEKFVANFLDEYHKTVPASVMAKVISAAKVLSDKGNNYPQLQEAESLFNQLANASSNYRRRLENRGSMCIETMMGDGYRIEYDYKISMFVQRRIKEVLLEEGIINSLLDIEDNSTSLLKFLESNKTIGMVFKITVKLDDSWDSFCNIIRRTHKLTLDDQRLFKLKTLNLEQFKRISNFVNIRINEEWPCYIDFMEIKKNSGNRKIAFHNRMFIASSSERNIKNLIHNIYHPYLMNIGIPYFHFNDHKVCDVNHTVSLYQPMINSLEPFVNHITYRTTVETFNRDMVDSSCTVFSFFVNTGSTHCYLKRDPGIFTYKLRSFNNPEEKIRKDGTTVLEYQKIDMGFQMTERMNEMEAEKIKEKDHSNGKNKTEVINVKNEEYYLGFSVLKFDLSGNIMDYGPGNSRFIKFCQFRTPGSFNIYVIHFGLTFVINGDDWKCLNPDATQLEKDIYANSVEIKNFKTSHGAFVVDTGNQIILYINKDFRYIEKEENKLSILNQYSIRNTMDKIFPKNYIILKENEFKKKYKSFTSIMINFGIDKLSTLKEHIDFSIIEGNEVYLDKDNYLSEDGRIIKNVMYKMNISRSTVNPDVPEFTESTEPDVLLYTIKIGEYSFQCSIKLTNEFESPHSGVQEAIKAIEALLFLPDNVPVKIVGEHTNIFDAMSPSRDILVQIPIDHLHKLKSPEIFEACIKNAILKYFIDHKYNLRYNYMTPYIDWDKSKSCFNYETGPGSEKKNLEIFKTYFNGHDPFSLNLKNVIKNSHSLKKRGIINARKLFEMKDEELHWIENVDFRSIYNNPGNPNYLLIHDLALSTAVDGYLLVQIEVKTSTYMYPALNHLAANRAYKRENQFGLAVGTDSIAISTPFSDWLPLLDIALNVPRFVINLRKLDPDTNKYLINKLFMIANQLERKNHIYVKDFKHDSFRPSFLSILRKIKDVNDLQSLVPNSSYYIKENSKINIFSYKVLNDFPLHTKDYFLSKIRQQENILIYYIRFFKWNPKNVQTIDKDSIIKTLIYTKILERLSIMGKFKDDKLVSRLYSYLVNSKDIDSLLKNWMSLSSNKRNYLCNLS